VKHYNFENPAAGELIELTSNQLEPELRSQFEKRAVPTDTTDQLVQHIKEIFNTLNPLASKRFNYITHKWRVGKKYLEYLIKERARLAHMSTLNGDKIQVLDVMSKIPDPVAHTAALELTDPTLLEIRAEFDKLDMVQSMTNKFTESPIQKYCYSSKVAEVCQGDRY
jgi:hypothetical protein